MSRNIFSLLCIENILWPSGKSLRYLGGSIDIELCVSKKNRDHTAHQFDYISGKAKTIVILKHEAQSQLRIFWQNLMFLAETFSKWAKKSVVLKNETKS